MFLWLVFVEYINHSFFVYRFMYMLIICFLDVVDKAGIKKDEMLL